MLRKNRRLNKLLAPLLCLLILYGMTVPAFAAGLIAVKSSQPIYVDNILTEMTMYNINGSNYARLRDIGQAVGFNVIYDAETRAIHIKTDEPYSAGSSALGQAPDTAEVAQTIQTVYIDGEQTYITAYGIGGNNYVKLANLGELVGFGVSWDSDNNRVMVRSLNPQTAGTPTITQDEPPAMTIDEMKAEIVRLTNAERVKAGLPEVEVLPALMDCAQAKADDMRDNHYFSHTSPIYGTFGEMIRSFVSNTKGTGENLKSLTTWVGSVQEAFETWMDSPGHRDNILEPRYTHIGVGISIDSKGVQKWVQHFASMQK